MFIPFTKWILFEYIETVFEWMDMEKSYNNLYSPFSYIKVINIY
jgi:hypothetical protein